jgi:hypothetical protein
VGWKEAEREAGLKGEGEEIDIPTTLEIPRKFVSHKAVTRGRQKDQRIK